MILPRYTHWNRYENKVLLLIATITFISRAALAFRSNMSLVSYPFLDDTFFVLSIARNVAHGLWFSVDGIHLTNGFHPLIIFFYTPLYLVWNDPISAIRSVYVISAFLDSAFIYLIAALVRDLSKAPIRVSLGVTPAIIAALIWAISDSILFHTSNGLETSLVGVLLALCCRLYVRIWRSKEQASVAQYARLGLLLGITVLARIDSAVLVASLFAFEFFRIRRRRVAKVFVLACIPLIITSPWWLYNVLYFGSLMPVSGQAESLFSSVSENLDHALVNIANLLTNIFYITYYGTPFWVHVAWATIVAVGWFTVFKLFKVHRLSLRSHELRPLVPFAISAVCLMIYYVFFFRGSFFIARYYHPGRILAVATTAIVLFHLVQELHKKRWSRIGLATVSVVAILAIAFNGVRYLRYYKSSNQSGFFGAGRWASIHSEGKVGMISSGTAGYFAPNIVNLDGKVSLLSLRAVQSGRLGEYIRDVELKYIADARTVNPRGKNVNLGFPLCLDSVLFDARQAGVEFELYDSLPSPDGVTPTMLFYRRTNIKQLADHPSNPKSDLSFNSSSSLMSVSAKLK